jgi:hypothetical protein
MAIPWGTGHREGVTWKPLEMCTGVSGRLTTEDVLEFYEVWLE